jgi:hypothetical protein
MHTLTPSTTIKSSTFNKVWLQNLSINCNTSGHATIVAVFKPYDGTRTLDDPKTLVINNVFEKIAADETFATVVDTLLQEIERQAKLANVI